MSESGYQRKPARYAKGKIAIVCESDGSGIKTRAMRLACLVGKDRYSHREHAYIMTEGRADLFERLFKLNYDAAYVTNVLITPSNKRLTLQEYEAGLRKRSTIRLDRIA